MCLNPHQGQCTCTGGAEGLTQEVRPVALVLIKRRCLHLLAGGMTECHASCVRAMHSGAETDNASQSFVGNLCSVGVGLLDECL